MRRSCYTVARVMGKANGGSTVVSPRGSETAMITKMRRVIREKGVKSPFAVDAPRGEMPSSLAWLHRLESNQLLAGYEPAELPMLYCAI